MIAAVILAGGSSSRMGQAKQLLKFENEYLIQKLNKDLESVAKSVYIISGCYHKEMTRDFNHMNLIYNENWKNGMGSSLACAVSALADTYSHLLVCTCDQVQIPKTHYQQLTQISNNNPQHIIVSSYNNTIGIPAIFPQKYFRELIKLNQSDSGAKPVINKYIENVISIDCHEAGFDLDTWKDWENFIQES